MSLFALEFRYGTPICIDDELVIIYLSLLYSNDPDKSRFEAIRCIFASPLTPTLQALGYFAANHPDQENFKIQ